jgi:hypothetical protein
MTLNELNKALSEALCECRTISITKQNSIAEKVASYMGNLEYEINAARDEVQQWKDQSCYSVNAIEAQGFLRGLEIASELCEDLRVAINDD